ncbi:hypothetical protein SY83_13435 [Paenibacillus swuensis]|uniref:4-hydroxy-tetrahydrodipicolinate synthase n=1 Tax=Paenibacillus swuensis TaxID=1178515 RepID=A0A172TPD4_9BACL|nr:4-hydroxy-tetrahydrodipicolinate synthase [Paenibacillus swuensis]ANE48915.1 hypothetical protein SY83_13435 [Paenibacillus swuensis]
MPALITPLHADQSVNVNTLRKQVNRFLDSGVHGLYVLGTTGEFYALCTNDKLLIAQTVINEANGRLPVHVGVGGNSTEDVIRMSRNMADLGADVLSVITPYFMKFTQAELLNHYERIAEGSSLPILLYNIPLFTQNILEPDTVKTLSSHSNIIGIKDTSGNMDLTTSYINYAGPEFSVLGGTDSQWLDVLKAGGDGAISALTNLVPTLFVEIYRSYMSGEREKAEHLQQLIQPLHEATGKATIPAALKYLMHSAGFEVGEPKLPALPVDNELAQALTIVVEDYRDYLYIYHNKG